MYYHIILTELCNSKCRYCYEKSLKEFDNGLDKKFKFELSAPANLEIELEKLKDFLSKDPSPKLIFYGGEPLVNLKKLLEIMDFLEDSVEYYMQTNGKLLNKVPKEYMNKFKRILVSIDGDKKRTDFNRGKGTYELVLKNIELIRKSGFKGEIVARMTIAQDCPDIYIQIKHLIKLIDKKLFDSIHWQLDAGFYKNDFNEKKFSEFVEEYNENISKLVKYWYDEIEKGKVLKIYPFLGIFESFYYNKKTKLRCGAGHSGYAITTNGKITACPIMNNIKDFYCGDLDTPPSELRKIELLEPCKTCEVKEICGGRCLYSNYAKLWPEKGQALICKTIKHIINEIKKITPKIKKQIEKGIVSEKDFEYEKYFGPEIIP